MPQKLIDGTIQSATRLEIQLLQCCSRTYIDPQTVDRIKKLLQEEDLDWTYLIQTGCQHCVIPLLYFSINNTCSEAVPLSIISQLRQDFHANFVQNIFFTKKLLKILDLFAANNIRAIPFKGPVLAVSVYGNLAFRQFCDLDILVHKQDIRKAKELLISQGYRLTSELFWQNEFVSQDGRFNIDLHRAITPRYFSFSLDFDGLWERLQPVSLTGKTVPNLSPEDLLLILCVYLVRDCWQKQERLIQICDIAELLRAFEGLDWRWIIEQATRLGSKRILFLGLLLAHNLLEAELPEEILQRIQADSVVKSLAAQVREWLFCETDTSNFGLDRKLFYVKVRERLQDIIPHFPYFLDYWITPSQTDCDFFPLPDYLSFLYYLVRQIRLIGQYGVRLFKRLVRI